MHDVNDKKIPNIHACFGDRPNQGCSFVRSVLTILVVVVAGTTRQVGDCEHEKLYVGVKGGGGILNSFQEPPFETTRVHPNLLQQTTNSTNNHHNTTFNLICSFKPATLQPVFITYFHLTRTRYNIRYNMISSTRVRALTKTLRKSPRGRLIQHHYHSTQFFQTSATSETQVPVCASVTSLHSLKGSHQHQQIISLRTNTNGINLSYIKSAPLHRWRRNFSTAIESIGIETEPADDDDNSKYAYDGVNARAEIKLNTLNETLTLANQSRSLYQKSKRTNTNTSLSLSEESLLNIHDNWKEQEVKLSDAYSKAIKYTARLRTKDVAKKAQILLDDMISRHGSIQEESNFLSKHDGPQFSDPIVMDLVNAIEQEYSTSRSASSASTSTSAKELELTRDGVPIPTSKDFANVLHSWASSKVKRKGLHAESLLYRMIELAYFYPENFSMPDSKTFGLVVKCHAGSTCKLCS